MAEPIHNPEPSEIEYLNRLFLEIGKNPEANQELNTIASQDQIQFFYSTAIIISSLPIPTKEEDMNSSEYQLFRVAITLITRCLKPFKRSSRDIVQEYINRVPPEIHGNLCQLFSNILSSPSDDIRSPASIIISQLIRIEIAASKTKNRSELLESIVRDYDSYDNDFKKIGALEALTICNEEEIVSTKTRVYRTFLKKQFERAVMIFTSDISQNYKMLGLKALNVLFQKPNSRIIGQTSEFECLNSILLEFGSSPETIEYYSLLCSTAEILICDLLPDLSAEVLSQIYDVINFECPSEECLPLLKRRIQVWKSVIKTQNKIINDMKSKQKDISEVQFFLIAPQLCDQLLEVICAGDYTELTDPDTYQPQCEALKALQFLGAMIPQYLSEKAMVIYQEIATEHPDQIVVCMCIWQVQIQIKEVDAPSIMSLMEQVFEISTNPAADFNTKVACLNVMQVFIECRLNHENDDGNQGERIEQLLATIDFLFQSGNSSLYSRIFQALNSFFKAFLKLGNDSYLQVFASQVYERMEHYLSIAQSTNNPNLLMDGYYCLNRFISSLVFSDFVVHLYSIYSLKFQEQAQLFIETGGKSGEKGIFEEISLVLRAILSKMNGKVDINIYSSIVSPVINSLHVSLEQYLIILLAQLVSCLGSASANFAEEVCEIYSSSVELNNSSIIVASCILISVLFQEADEQNQYLKSIAVGIWDSLYSFFTNEDLAELSTSSANNILEGLSSMISFISPENFFERREKFFNLLESITKNIPEIRKIDFNDDYLFTLAQIFYGYKRVIEMYKEQEFLLINNQETRNQSFIFANCEKYFVVIKTASENFDYMSSSNADKMIMAFLSFLEQLIKGIGRPINLQLNARWVKSLYEYALYQGNKDMKNYANEIKNPYNNL